MNNFKEMHDLIQKTDSALKKFSGNHNLTNAKIVFAGTPDSDTSIVAMQLHCDSESDFHLIADADSFDFGWTLFSEFVNFYDASRINSSQKIFRPDKSGNITRELVLVM